MPTRARIPNGRPDTGIRAKLEQEQRGCENGIHSSQSLFCSLRETMSVMDNGNFPAGKAARMNPTDAFRYE